MLLEGSTTSIILIVVLVLLLVLYPILMVNRNKKEQEKQRMLTESLKVGEYVLTYSGIFGKISEIVEKEAGKFIVIETGEKNKTFVTVSENAIYTVTNNNLKAYGVNGDVLPAEETKEIKPISEPVIVTDEGHEKKDTVDEEAIENSEEDNSSTEDISETTEIEEVKSEPRKAVYAERRSRRTKKTEE